jgi:bifunctional non-homologous end joining protein LigD
VEQANLFVRCRIDRDEGAAIFRQACAIGLEGIVSKRLSAAYRSGPSRDWLTTKNPDSPAMIRAREEEV